MTRLPVIVVAACELVPDHHHGDTARYAYKNDADAILWQVL
jgi:hypothetical protein